MHVKKPTIGVIDTKCANFHSVCKALDKVGAVPYIVKSSSALMCHNGAVLPGVGTSFSAMDALKERGLDKGILEFIKSGLPILGVCVGMQLLFDFSEEGGTVHPTLGVLAGKVVKVPNKSADYSFKIPHIGWNSVHFKKSLSHPVFYHLNDCEEFYFVHSFYCVPDDNAITAASVTYSKEMCCAIAKDNVVGVQFHAEKSSIKGLQIYKNFVNFVAQRM